MNSMVLNMCGEVSFVIYSSMSLVRFCCWRRRRTENTWCEPVDIKISITCFPYSSNGLTVDQLIFSISVTVDSSQFSSLACCEPAYIQPKCDYRHRLVLNEPGDIQPQCDCRHWLVLKSGLLWTRWHLGNFTNLCQFGDVDFKSRLTIKPKLSVSSTRCHPFQDLHIVRLSS